MASINIVEENVPEVGGWSGTCKCPNGKEYKVGDYHNACASIACIGGVSSGCNRNDRSGLNRRVTCARNKVEENVPNVGGWSGTCTCPDGKTYKVGDNNNACASIACIGGVSSGCNRHDRSGRGRRVTCVQPATTGNGSSSESIRETFFNTVKNSIDDGNAHIIPAIQNIVLKFGELDPVWASPQAQVIAMRFSDGDFRRTQSRYWVPLIWNALKINGYDVPDQLIANDFGEELRQRLIINSTELSQIQNWDKYAIEVLSNAYTESYTGVDNNFDSQKVRDLSERYKASSANKNFDHLKNYRQKYLKYKKKYLLLKSQTL
jgi:hypothetical protein